MKIQKTEDFSPIYGHFDDVAVLNNNSDIVPLSTIFYKISRYYGMNPIGLFKFDRDGKDYFLRSAQSYNGDSIQKIILNISKFVHNDSYIIHPKILDSGRTTEPDTLRRNMEKSIDKILAIDKPLQRRVNTYSYNNGHTYLSKYGIYIFGNQLFDTSSRKGLILHNIPATIGIKREYLEEFICGLFLSKLDLLNNPILYKIYMDTPMFNATVHTEVIGNRLIATRIKKSYLKTWEKIETIEMSSIAQHLFGKKVLDKKQVIKKLVSH